MRSNARFFRSNKQKARKSIGRGGFRPRCEELEGRLLMTTLPPDFYEFTLATGFANPTAMVMAPDGRIFITQQNGQVRIFDWERGLLPTPFLTVTTTTVGERGLQGMAFDPNYLENGYVYVYYTQTSAPVSNRVSRFTTDPANPDQVLAGSEHIVIRLDPLSGATNHNGGGILFGYDGMLYLSTGENATTSFSQSLANNLGKVLRIDVNGDDYPADPFRNFAVPEYNPYPTSARPEILSLGFRNPFTMAMHLYTGQIYVNDVGGAGTARREEINDLYGPDFASWGGNFGWPIREGIAGDPRFVDPIFAYNPSFGGFNCAIVGSDFYTYYDPATGFPEEYQNDFFFADYCGGWIYRYDHDTGTAVPFATGTGGMPIDVMGDGFSGFLFYLLRSGGGTPTSLRMIFYYPTGGPGAPGGSEMVPDGVLVGALTSSTPVVQQIASETLAELPPTMPSIDQLFANPAPVEEAEAPAVATEPAVPLVSEFWQAI
jgi:glucose/arabinose dehydrogenase